MKLLLIKPVIDFSETKLSEDGGCQRKYIYRFHLFVFYMYLTYFNKLYCA